MDSMPHEILKYYLNLPRTTHIKLLGDSITHGVGGTNFSQNGYSFINDFARNPNGYCWANLFKKHLENNYDCTVTNNACSGTNIQFIIENFDRLVDTNDDLIICTIGTNNRHRFFKDGDKPTKEELGNIFYKNLLKLHNMFKEANKKVIFIANIPASLQNEQDGKDYWRVLHMDDINKIHKIASKDSDFPLISMYDLFNQYCKENNLIIDSLLADSLHPNDQGYDIIYTLLLKAFNLS